MNLRWYQEEAVQSLFDFYSKPRQHDQNGLPVRKNALVCLPTGTGKSLVIADFIKRAMLLHPSTRAMMATHVKTLIKQNAAKMQEAWPLSPLGIYSAGLKSRDAVQPIIFGGVQSLVGKYPIFGNRDFLVIDEAHLVGEDGSYLKFIHELMYGHSEYEAPVTRQMFERALANPSCNPYLKVIGLSATAYRLGMGSLKNGRIFSDITYDLCNFDGFTRLIVEGFLAPLIGKPTKVQLDLKGVGLSGGDFVQSQLQKAVDKQEVTYAALCEMMTLAADRQCWMIFASGVEHAEHINEMLNNIFGVPSVVMHSGSKEYPRTDADNDKALVQWKSGQVRCAVSMGMLTTGVDHPPVDCIGMLRPTASTGLWVQMLGRGTRPYDCNRPGDVDPAAFPYVKANCLVLDYAGNTRRLGPINDPIIPRQKGEGPPGEAPVRICHAGSPECQTYNHTRATHCVVCGTEFTMQEHLNRAADDVEPMKEMMPDIQSIPVDRMVMVPYITAKGVNVIRIAFYCGRQTYFDMKTVETPIHFWRHKSREWFRQVYDYSTPVHEIAKVNYDDEGKPDNVPNNNADVLKLVGNFRTPRAIRVWLNANPKPEIQGYEF